jgi:hypothetical protein
LVKIERQILGLRVLFNWIAIFVVNRCSVDMFFLRDGIQPVADAVVEFNDTNLIVATLLHWLKRPFGQHLHA